MTDLLIRNIEPQLKREIEERARKNRQSLSAEAKALIRRGLSSSDTATVGIGTLLYSLVDERDRGDDLVFELHDLPAPPDFE